MSQTPTPPRPAPSAEDDAKAPIGASAYLEGTAPHAQWPFWPEAIAATQARMAQDGGHDWGHLLRVFRHAHTLWRAEAPEDPAMWRIIATSALFHDLVNLPKDSPERHLASTQSADEATAWLKAHTDFTEDERARVHEAIQCHSFSSGYTPTSLAAQILCDADRLDALGAIGIARTFFVGGTLERHLWHPTDPMATERPPDDLAWCVDHFFIKLLKLEEGFHTTQGRHLASERTGRMRRFLAALRDELGEEHLPSVGEQTTGVDPL